MSANEDFWNFFWEVRLREMEDLGKREAILTASRLIRSFAESKVQPVRILELGCGTGQVIGALAQAHADIPGINQSIGVDYLPAAIEKCRHDYPSLTFFTGDFTDQNRLAALGQFQILLLVNAMHEVFSAAYSQELQEVDVPAAKASVRRAFASAVSCLAPNGSLVLFDGLEMPGDLRAPIRIRFLHPGARRRFDIFAREYHPFKITFREVNDPYTVELSRRDFTRYIDKSIFLEKRLWATERLESYQYFNEYEFREVLAGLGMTIIRLDTLTVNEEKWRAEVEILTPGADFPTEHILIVAQHHPV
jgi:SAM-dependent methyltransferase